MRNKFGIVLYRKVRHAKISEDVFHLLVDSIRDYAIFLIDARGHIMSWNKGAERIKGYSEAEVLGKHISVFYTSAEIQRGEPEKNLKIAKETGRLEQEACRVRK